MEVRDIRHRQMCTERHRSSLVCTSVTSKPPLSCDQPQTCRGKCYAMLPKWI